MDDGTVSSPPPSSSPTLMTPPEDLLDETASRKMVVLYPKGNHKQLLPLYDSLANPGHTGAETPQDDREELVACDGSNLGNTAGQLSFSERLHHLLRAVQLQRHGSHASHVSRPSLLSPLLATLPESGVLSAASTSVCDTVSPPLSGSDPANISSLGSHQSIGPTGPTSDSQPADVRPLYLASRKRSREERPHTPIRHTSQHGSAAPASSARTRPLKKCRLSSSTRRAASKGPRAQPEKATVAGLSGAFGFRYAKGAGSLRRAESLRSDVERMTERIDTGVTVSLLSCGK
ncbi:hypothetical protein C2E23DRAFT_427207 [Lenzites betulinus]|nr:hypothetical protein C2E23DRAFT_427207 [Lenzites betulinus]